jgi:hypothetical protein
VSGSSQMRQFNSTPNSTESHSSRGDQSH